MNCVETIFWIFRFWTYSVWMTNSFQWQLICTSVSTGQRDASNCQSFKTDPHRYWQLNSQYSDWFSLLTIFLVTTYPVYYCDVLFQQANWLPIDLNFMQHLWVPNIFVYNLASFEALNCLEKLAGLWIVDHKNLFYNQVKYLLLLHAYLYKKSDVNISPCWPFNSSSF